jgi:hypothetical protein
MKYLRLFILCIFPVVFLSCEDDGKAQQAEELRAQKYNDSILKIISSNWRFNVPVPNAGVQQQLANWNEWHQFKNELAQKPASTLDAYRQKTKNLAEKADQLQNNIPPVFDKPNVKSRIGVLITKVRSLYTYINLNVAQDKKVVSLINEINRETTSIQSQFDEIIRKNRIQREAGEEEMLRALDTVRMANPDIQPQPGQPDQTLQQQQLNASPGQTDPQGARNRKMQRLQQIKAQN